MLNPSTDPSYAISDFKENNIPWKCYYEAKQSDLSFIEYMKNNRMYAHKLDANMYYFIYGEHKQQLQLGSGDSQKQLTQ